MWDNIFDLFKPVEKFFDMLFDKGYVYYIILGIIGIAIYIWFFK